MSFKINGDINEISRKICFKSNYILNKDHRNDCYHCKDFKKCEKEV
ncbi:hypothetical protein LCGC14_1355980 [marine sediment metagenome]|uniref:Uncharacterized protein n=1 Tax=marine sediment metagenome TaxID=412755 RepID=A0A0F9NBU6_9ZZZZ